MRWTIVLPFRFLFLSFRFYFVDRKKAIGTQLATKVIFYHLFYLLVHTYDKICLADEKCATGDGAGMR